MISRNEYGKPINKGRFFFCSECISAYALLIFIPAFIYSCSDSGMDSHDYANHAFTEIRIAGASAYASDSPEGNTVDIFIYDDDKAGRLDTYQRAVLSHDLMVEAASRTGDKVMAVIVNPQNDGYEWDEISSYEALMNIYADLRMEDAGHPTMSGTFRFRANAAGSVLETAVTPLMSEIRLRSLRCDFSATPYSGAVMTDVSVCLSNANSAAGLFRQEGFMPEAPVNTQGTPEGAETDMPNPEILTCSIDGDVGSSAVNTDISLYCYPNECEEENTGSPFTRLVISGNIMGKRYYYPVNINRGEFGPVAGAAGIGRNRSYVFDVVLRRTGALTPHEAVLPGTVELSCSVVAWSENGDTEIIF